MSTTSANNTQCSFCRSSKDQVKHLISGSNNAFICDNCVDKCHGALHTIDSKQDKEWAMQHVPKPREVYDYLSEYVIGQDRAKKALSVAAYNHYKLHVAADLRDNIKSDLHDVEIAKSNVFLVGPSGCGKTLLVSTLARKLDVPFAIADATTLTETGYIGEDVESVLFKLLVAAKFDLARARRGIVYIDEIDKIGRKSAGSSSSSRDISGEGVQQALLTMIDGNIVSVPTQGSRKGQSSDNIEFDTRGVLFIVSGHFGRPLLEAIAARLGNSSMGFGVHIRNLHSQDYKELMEHIDGRDLVKYGLIPEFVGRIPIVATLDELDVDALTDILSRPKNAILKQYTKLFAIDNVKLEVEHEARRTIAKQALERQSGARGLRAIMERVLMEAMFMLPHDNRITKIVITEDVVLRKRNAVLLGADGLELEPMLVVDHQAISS